ncbi:fatty acid desaturase [Geothermobacter hydrogeniphilus]|uniref:Fatty acid desaturase n=1 Tax=Geothermobacter hydrogeniphilus TaxID=1969733 RepID=A0A1X0Y3N7_9BACT|nr:fatty acid desaturase [Geothermobacter hydrogeniphilus]ORJ59795.1 fatty acid desaturase [Geothermobacter hydrogeniphilus]
MPVQPSDPGRNWPDRHPQLAPFCKSDNRRALWQVVNTVGPYLLLWSLAVNSIEKNAPWPLTGLILIFAAAFLVRIFILFHDCVHGSFFTARKANTFFGYLFGLLVFTSFEDWRFTHLRHHATYANLDARGFGDIWTMTVEEYRSSSRWKRLGYRLYRHPLVLLGLGALFNFLLHNRLPDRRARRQEAMSVALTNLLLLAIALIAGATIGWRTYLIVQLPVLWLAGAMGIWLFYVQHQFEGGYWARKEDWDPLRAAMVGSSFYQLPALFDWFSGHIGYHHIHHLKPRIPNYFLPICQRTIPALKQKRPIRLRQSLSCTRVKLWDEAAGRMVDFSGETPATGN